MLKIHPHLLDIPNMSEQQWNDLLNARTEFIVEHRPGEPGPSHQAQREFISQIPELRDHVAFWLLYDEDAHCVGYCTIAHPKPENPDYAANKDRIYVEPVVLARYRRQGVGTQLLPLIVDHAQKVGATWIQWDTKFESGFRFSEKIRATEVGRQRTNRLTVDQLNWEMMQRWVEEGRSHNPEVELVRFVNLPAPGLIDPICDLITDINRNQPKDDLEGTSFTLTSEEFISENRRLTERKIERVILCAREPDDTLSGMTDLFYSEANPTHAHVSLTGVRREYQNRGLGKWLKAAMILDMRERYPKVRFVDTNNFNNNRPILNINDRMGFELFEQFVFYKVRVHDLAAKVESTASSHSANLQA
jgi:mycothiol synthase